MPRNKKKATAAASSSSGGGGGGGCDDDRMSVVSDSNESTTQQQQQQQQQQHSDDEGVSEEESYEQKVREAMDLALEKSTHTRTNALIALTTAMQKRVLTSFLVDNYQAIVDLVERSLRKGRGPEQVAAARLASMLVLTLSSVGEVEEAYQALVPVLRVGVSDPSGPRDGRTEAAHSLALCTFLGAHDLTHVTQNMNTLHAVFSASLPKGNGELPTHPPALTALHTAALNGFCLLMCLLSPATVHTMANKLAKEMFDLLGSSDLDLRIQAGEGVALLYEVTRQHDPRYRWCREKELCALLNELATDSHKFRAKKDRKQQRASFRDVVRTVEDREEGVVGETVSIGPQVQREELVLDSWSLRLQYQSLCRILTQGLNAHFAANVGVRDVFSLGPPPVLMTATEAQLARKGQKKYTKESPATKAWQMSRNKSRDNKSAAKMYDD